MLLLHSEKKRTKRGVKFLIMPTHFHNKLEYLPTTRCVLSSLVSFLCVGSPAPDLCSCWCIESRARGKTDQEEGKKAISQPDHVIYFLSLVPPHPPTWQLCLGEPEQPEKMKRFFLQGRSVRPFVCACRSLTCKALVYSETGNPSEKVK